MFGGQGGVFGFDDWFGCGEVWFVDFQVDYIVVGGL